LDRLWRPDAFSRLEFGDLRASLNMLQLHKGMSRLTASTQAAVGKTLATIAAYAEDEVSSAHAVGGLDEAVLSIVRSTDSGDHEAAIDLVGIRLALFPDAPPPEDRRA
jgi:hypothetical protein